MRTATSLILAATLFITGGCLVIPSPYAAELKPAIVQYQSVGKGTLRSAIDERFGPVSRVEDGASVWETRINDLNRATLRIWFDANDKVRRTEVIYTRGVSQPGYHASATTTWTK